MRFTSKSFLKAYDFPVIFTRAANVYGPDSNFIGQFLEQLLVVKQEANAVAWRWWFNQIIYSHQRRISATLMLGLEAEKGTTWHLSTEKALSIKELVSEICNITNTNFEEIVKLVMKD